MAKTKLEISPKDKATIIVMALYLGWKVAKDIWDRVKGRKPEEDSNPLEGMNITKGDFEKLVKSIVGEKLNNTPKG